MSGEEAVPGAEAPEAAEEDAAEEDAAEEDAEEDLSSSWRTCTTGNVVARLTLDRLLATRPRASESRRPARLASA